jgi:hypothetical protein
VAQFTSTLLRLQAGDLLHSVCESKQASEALKLTSLQGSIQPPGDNSCRSSVAKVLDRVSA